MRHPTNDQFIRKIGIKLPKHDPPSTESIVITITVESTAYVANDQI